MLLTISTTARPATDLGFLLYKNPASVRSVELAFGTAHVFYPEAAEDHCTAALLVEVDPVGLVRRGRARSGFALAEYVNDRPYAASSFLSVAIAKVYGTAMSGRSRDRQELADNPIPLDAHLPVVPCRGGPDLLRRLFEPLGYTCDVAPIPLDAERPDWGESRYVDLTVRAEIRLRDLLRHLYVLLPVLDDDKHYWVERAEIDKLLAKGEDWLPAHPERELITRRFLRHRGPLMREALARLAEDSGEDLDERAGGGDEAALERGVGLAERRLGAVIAVLRSCGATSVADLGRC
jgi:3' terminal RNA ribose 2'-O-methyltransferase Hen1